jgi:hypothetical protein
MRFRRRYLSSLSRGLGSDEKERFREGGRAQVVQCWGDFYERVGSNIVVRGLGASTARPCVEQPGHMCAS